MACDICGKTGTYLTDLLTSYRLPDVVSICPDCEKVVNKQHRKIQGITASLHSEWLRRFIRNRKEQSKK